MSHPASVSSSAIWGNALFDTDQFREYVRALRAWDGAATGKPRWRHFVVILLGDISMKATISAIALLGVCQLANASTSLGQADCGRELTKGHYALVEDMTCVGTGLIIIENNVKVDLAGYTMTGYQHPNTDGIDIRADNAHIEGNGGTITQFSNGVRIGDFFAPIGSGREGPFNNNHVNGVRFVLNRVQVVDLKSFGDRNGVLIDNGSANNKVTNCVSNNNHRGVLVRDSESNMVKNSNLDGNDIGVGVCCGSSRNQILQNTATGNSASYFGNTLTGGFGILLFGDNGGSSNNLVQGNTANDNEIVGIWSNALAKDNNILVNTAEGNSIYDVIDGDTAECTNLWVNNAYGIAAPAGPLGTPFNASDVASDHCGL